MKVGITVACFFSALFLSVQNLDVRALGSKDTTSGTLTVNGNTVQLEHVYVIDWDDDIGIFLSDVPFSPDQDPFALAVQGKIKGISFIICKETKTRIVEAIYDLSFRSGWIHTLGESCSLELTSLEKKAIEGRLFTAKPEKWGVDNKGSFTYDVTFKASIRPHKEDSAPIRVFGEGRPRLIGEEATMAPCQAFASYHVAMASRKVESARSSMSKQYIEKFKTNE